MLPFQQLLGHDGVSVLLRPSQEIDKLNISVEVLLVCYKMMNKFLEVVGCAVLVPLGSWYVSSDLYLNTTPLGWQEGIIKIRRRRHMLILNLI